MENFLNQLKNKARKKHKAAIAIEYIVILAMMVMGLFIGMNTLQLQFNSNTIMASVIKK